MGSCSLALGVAWKGGLGVVDFPIHERKVDFKWLVFMLLTQDEKKGLEV